MRSYIIASSLNNFPGFHGCVMCGFCSFTIDGWLKHFNEFHTLPGDKWEISEFCLPTNPNQKVWVIHNEPLT